MSSSSIFSKSKSNPPLNHSRQQSSAPSQSAQSTEVVVKNDSEPPLQPPPSPPPPPPPSASQAQLDLIVQLGLYLELKQLLRKNGSKRSKTTIDAAKEAKSSRTLNTNQYNNKNKQAQVMNEFALEKINKILLKRNLSYDESMFRLTGASDVVHTSNRRQTKNNQNGNADTNADQHENNHQQQSDDDYDINNQHYAADESCYEDDEEEYFDVDGFEEDIREEKISTNEDHYGGGGDSDEATSSLNEKKEINRESIFNQVNSTIQLNSEYSTCQIRQNAQPLQENHYHDYDSTGLDSSSIKLNNNHTRAPQLQSVLMRQQQLLNINLIMEDEIDSSIASILSDAYKLKPLIPYHLYALNDTDDQHLITDGISNISCSSHNIAFDSEPLIGREWLSREIEKVSLANLL
jgi:hypothetical protein